MRLKYLCAAGLLAGVALCRAAAGPMGPSLPDMLPDRVEGQGNGVALSAAKLATAPADGPLAGGATPAAATVPAARPAVQEDVAADSGLSSQSYALLVGALLVVGYIARRRND